MVISHRLTAPFAIAVDAKKNASNVIPANISLNEALAATLRAAVTLPLERVPLCEALHRILASDVASDMDMPPFAKSAMDGFACRRVDITKPLTVAGEVPAGQVPTIVVGEGQCVRIMTGAPVPTGADCVVMVEHTQLSDDGDVMVVAPDGQCTKDNICTKGEDVHKGDIVLKRGIRLGPPHIAMLAAVGFADVPVIRRPVVGIIATGSELVEPEKAIGGAMIRNSNSCQVVAQTQQMNALPNYYGIVDDTLEAIRSAIARAREACDVVIVSGGVSMGAYDFVPEALLAEGYRFEYKSVAMQPGKPTLFGTSKNGRYCFGLPGNPVSALVVFELIIKPFLYRLMGHDFAPAIIMAKLSDTFRRKKAKRQSSLPVRFTGPGKVALVDYHGSAHIGAFCDADGILTVPKGVKEIEKGTVVHVRCL
ncbi:MAG: molybdopterin molybdotransferase MoeA [Deltaproteobacteria bacterium]|nr:molybdopterin molybdotransferase MoeA [Deltaproteobacteria bacterium]